MNPLLLADPSPSLRLRALTELAEAQADDPEAADLPAAIGTGPELARVLAERRDDTYALGYTLCRLAYLGHRGPESERLAGELFERQRPDGSWPLPAEARPLPKDRKAARAAAGRRAESYTMVPLQTAVPLRGLAAAGYATDPRAERGYEWLLAQRLADGAWPGSAKADLAPGAAPAYRRLAGSTGCRSSTTAALACLALHPARRSEEPARVALDHLLAGGTRLQWTLGWELSRLLAVERAAGQLTFYARLDVAFLLELAGRCGLSPTDERIAALVALVEALRGPFGLVAHPAHPELSRWLTFDLDASLARLRIPGSRAT